jgi:predicted aspartyl protease
VDIHRFPDWIVKLVTFIAIAALPICVSGEVAPQLAGYAAASIRYVPLNKMVVVMNVNGHSANLFVDTGINQFVLDADAAPLLGVKPSPLGLRYIGYTRFNGRQCPVAFVKSLAVGGTNLGSTSVILTTDAGSGSSNGPARVTGTLGADILERQQAVINCRTKFIFFKVDRSAPLRVASIASTENFTRVPLRREQNGGFTVPFSMAGRNGRLLLDTGAFVTTFDEALLKSLGIPLEPTPISARFSDRISRQYAMGEVKDLAIGDFKVPPGKFGSASLPKFALNRGGVSISGSLGMDLLYDRHAIIDFGGMNLFLK